MKNWKQALGVGAACALALGATSSRAADYQVMYFANSSDYTFGDGQIDVVNGVAVSGNLQIFSGPDYGTYTLVSGSGTSEGLTYNDAVNVNSSAFVDSLNGLLWSATGSAGGAEVDLWYNPVAQNGAPADSFSLWGANGNLQSYGMAELTPMQVVQQSFAPASVADGGSTAALLAAGITGLAALRRKLFR